MKPILPSASRDELIRNRSRDFAALARHLALHGDNADTAGELPDRVRLAVKAAVLGGALTDAGALSALAGLSTGWLETLRQNSVFDAMLSSMRRTPMLQRFAVSTVAFVADEVGEGVGKPIQQLTLDSIDPLLPRKTAAICVLTRELARTSGAPALIDAELRAGVSAGVDAVFLAALVDATTPTASAGNTAANTITDIAALLAAVPLGSASRPFFVFSPTAAKKLALKNTSGVFTWPAVTPSGGSIAGVPLLVSDQLPSGAALLVDAAGLAANGGDVRLDASREASLQMDNDPTMAISAGSPLAPVPVNVVSMFQTNSVAIRGDRTFAFRLLRDDAVASLSGVAY